MRTVSRVALILAILALGVLVPSVAAKDSWFFPDARSPVQREWQELFTQVFWAAAIVFIVVEGLLLYALLRFRRRKEGPQEGPHIHGNTKMEIAWTIAPTLVMAWLLVISLNQLDRVDSGPEPDFVVNVVARQFDFEFYYPPNYIDSTTKTLYVQENKVVGLKVTSIDVIHAFNVLELGVMIDAVPGKENEFWFLAESPGEYKFQCRELCGVGHGRMNGTVVVFAEGTQAVPFGKTPGPDSGTNETTPGNQTDPTNTTGPQGDVTERVVLDSFSITPTDFTAQPSQKLVLAVENVANIPHNLFIGKYGDGSNPEVLWKTKDLLQGEKESILVELPAEPGAWEWWCDVSGHKDSGMYGTLSTGGTVDAGPGPILPGPSPLLLLFALVGVVFVVRLRRRRA